jgi:NADPH2:quinone reductase
MKAIQVSEYGTSDVLEVVERDRPEPGPDEVVIETEVAGVNFADIMCRRGTYFEGPEPPYIPGFEAGGEIVAVGAESQLEVGQRAAMTVEEGAYAEYVCGESDAALPLPTDMDLEQATGFSIQFITAHNVLHEWGRLSDDERVLIHAAAGGVGNAAVQLADKTDAEIFATASTSEKLDFAAELGADHCIDYTETDFVDQVLTATDGEGVDLVLDGVGGETFERSLDILTDFSRIVTYGTASGTHEVSFDTRSLFFENNEILGYHLGHGMEHDPERVFAASDHLTPYLFGGELEVSIDKRFPLTDAHRAHEHIEQRGNIGKVMLTA